MRALKAKVEGEHASRLVLPSPLCGLEMTISPLGRYLSFSPFLCVRHFGVFCFPVLSSPEDPLDYTRPILMALFYCHRLFTGPLSSEWGFHIPTMRRQLKVPRVKVSHHYTCTAYCLVNSGSLLNSD